MSAHAYAVADSGNHVLKRMTSSYSKWKYIRIGISLAQSVDCATIDRK